jgi:hypothetical protein
MIRAGRSIWMYVQDVRRYRTGPDRQYLHSTIHATTRYMTPHTDTFTAWFPFAVSLIGVGVVCGRQR